MKAAIYTLGCKVNQYESQVIAEALIDNGYTMVEPTEIADVYIVNSCTVTSESDRKNRQIVRRLKRLNPSAPILLTGCMPQAYPEESEKLTQADIVIGNRDNHKIIEALNAYFKNPGRYLLTQKHQTGDAFAPCSIHHFYGRTRAEIKIEDGCNRFCSYCAIPYARGRVRSKALDAIRAEAKQLSDAGFCEIVLVGINLSAYDDNGHDICDAVNAAGEDEGILRVRLGSLEPDHLTDNVIERLAENPKLCPQFHISLQSGCDKTLRAMNRHYTAAEYKALAEKLRSTFPDATLTTDMMTGFPGETEEDHQISTQFAKDVGFEKIHIFPYSIRTGTRAATMPNQVDKAIKDARAAELSNVANTIRQTFLKSQIGRTLSVLIEEHKENDVHEGYTANYTPVRIYGECPVQGIVRVEITKTEDDFCVGYVTNCAE